MTTHNPKNERIKREYFSYLKEAKRYSESSLDGVAAALHRFEAYTKFKDFRSFHIQQAIGFKAQLSELISRNSGERLSKATLYATLTVLKNFFHWLAGRPGYKSRLSYADAEYFNLSDKETRVAKARRERPCPTLEQIHHTIQVMPSGSEIERRNRAVLAFAILTGARDGAIASLKLKHINLAEGEVVQDAREVKTKFSKSFTSSFFPVGDDIREVVEGWVQFLLEDRLWGLADPLFPATRIAVGESGGFEAAGLDRKHWSNASPIRGIFREAFTRAGLPYFNPHSFRKTLALIGEKVCRTPEEFKVWSQNLGHEKVLTTFTSYGQIAPNRQAEIMRRLSHSETSSDSNDQVAAQIADMLRQSGAFHG